MDALCKKINALELVYPEYPYSSELEYSSRRLCNIKHIQLLLGNGRPPHYYCCRYFSSMYCCIIIDGHPKCISQNISKILQNNYATLEKNTFKRHYGTYTTICPLCHNDTMDYEYLNQNILWCIRLCENHGIIVQNEMTQLQQKALVMTALPLLKEVVKIIIRFM